MVAVVAVVAVVAAVAAEAAVAVLTAVAADGDSNDLVTALADNCSNHYYVHVYCHDGYHGTGVHHFFFRFDNFLHVCVFFHDCNCCSI